MIEATAAWTMLATRILAPNPGPMTLEGTNTYIVRRPDSYQIVVIDPGPLHPGHLRRIASHGSVELILLTHHHLDHSESAKRLWAMTGAPVRSLDPSLCIDGPPLVDDEEFFAGGTRVCVVATPGHTGDSVSIHLPEDRHLGAHIGRGSMLTGDTVLGRGTTVIAHPDGSLRAYLASLERLNAIASSVVLPGHGPMLHDLAQVSMAYISHRLMRLGEVSSAIDRLNQSASEVTVASVTDLVYADVAPEVRFAAEASVKAQLDYLTEAAEKQNKRRGH